MTEKKPTVITIDDVDYTEDQLTEDQKVIISNLADLERKINSTRFNLYQLQVGRDAFAKMLTDSLKKDEDE